jgi:hypothetical protein
MQILIKQQEEQKKFIESKPKTKPIKSKVKTKIKPKPIKPKSNR